MKPLMYGYMRVDRDVRDADVKQTELALRFVAETEGYCFAAIFYEDDDGRNAAFDELAAELKRSEAHDVIVPSYDDISRHPLLRLQMCEWLSIEANAHVHTLEDHCATHR